MKNNKVIHKLTFREKLLQCKKEGNRIYKGIGTPFDCKLQAEICSSKNCPIGKEGVMKILGYWITILITKDKEEAGLHQLLKAGWGHVHLNPTRKIRNQVELPPMAGGQPSSLSKFFDRAEGKLPESPETPPESAH